MSRFPKIGITEVERGDEKRKGRREEWEGRVEGSEKVRLTALFEIYSYPFLGL